MAPVLAGLLILVLFLGGWAAMSRSTVISNMVSSDAQRVATELVGERAKTEIDITAATGDTANSNLTVTVKNLGATSVVDFSLMDVVVQYTPGNPIPLRPTYKASGPLSNGEWTMTLDPATDLFEPGIFNPGETMTITAKLVGSFAAGDTGTVTVGTPNGVIDTLLFTFQPYEWTLHSEVSSVGGTDYYQLKNQTPADGIAATISSSYAAKQTGRVSPTSNNGKFVFPLTGITQLAAGTWETTYRAKRDKANFGFVWSVTADDISLTSTGWQDIDLSSFIPVGATGAIVEVVNTTTSSSYSAVVKGKEDTRDYMSNSAFEEIEAETHRWQIVKVDSNRLIRGFVENLGIDFKLLGYTQGNDPAYFTIPLDVTPGTIDEWTTIDVSNYVDSDADGVILFIDSIDAGDREFGVQEVGSLDKNKDDIEEYGNTMWLVGLNPAKHFEAFVETANINIYLVGQTKSSVVYYSTDVGVSDPSTGSWVKLDADDYGVLAAANGLVFRVEGDNNDRRIGLRHGDNTTDNWNNDIGEDSHFEAAIGLNDANEWYEYMEDTDIDVFIAAYTRLVQMDVHGDIDVVIRQADGTIRATLATDVAESANITADTWQTFTATYTFPGYTVVDQTDYLEIDLFAEATANISEESVSVDFRIDDPSLAVGDQMKVREVP